MRYGINSGTFWIAGAAWNRCQFLGLSLALFFNTIKHIEKPFANQLLLKCEIFRIFWENNHQQTDTHKQINVFILDCVRHKFRLSFHPDPILFLFYFDKKEETCIYGKWHQTLTFCVNKFNLALRLFYIFIKKHRYNNLIETNCYRSYPILTVKRRRGQNQNRTLTHRVRSSPPAKYMIELYIVVLNKK